MKITSLVALIICMAFASAIVNSLHVFTTAGYNYDTKLTSTINDTVSAGEYLGAGVTTTGTLGLGDFIFGFFLFTKIFFTAIFIPATIFTGFGAPLDMAVLFSMPIYLIYIIAVIQFISGRYIET